MITDGLLIRNNSKGNKYRRMAYLNNYKYKYSNEINKNTRCYFCRNILHKIFHNHIFKSNKNAVMHYIKSGKARKQFESKTVNQMCFRAFFMVQVN